jgi:hypothetical protein
MARYLFTDTDIRVLIDLTKRRLIDEVGSLTDTIILSRTNEERLKDLIDEFSVHVPTLELTKAARTYSDGFVPQHQVPNPEFDNQQGVPGRIHTLHIPYRIKISV